MKKSYASDVVFLSTPEQVSQLLHLDDSKSEPWSEDELRDMVAHQMSASLEFDLGGVKMSEVESKSISESFTSAAQSDIKTFGELLKNPHPPIELLRLSHKFFKQRVRESQKGSPDHKLSYLFYLLSIVVARIRHGVNICRLKDDEQLQGIITMMKRDWVDEGIRQLLVEGQKAISAER